MLMSTSRHLLVFTLSFIIRLSLFMQVSHQSRNYVYGQDLVTQLDAKSYCRKHYTDLATFGSTSEINALQTPCSDQVLCWIGYERVTNGSPLFNWSDGEKNIFTQWKPGEPNNIGGTENCVVMKWNVWFDTSCVGTYGFLCYEDGPILVQENKTWEEALDHCKALQIDPYSSDNYFKHVYDLLHIRSGNFISIATSVILGAQTREVWIGLRFLAGSWLWVNENPLQLHLPVCPEAGKNCGTISKTGEVQLRDCSEKRNFFCSRN